MIKMKKKITDSDIVMEIYRRMYKASEPKADIDKIIKSGEGKMPNWFLAYYLSEEKTEDILNETLKEFKVPKYKRHSFSIEIYLGSAPCSSKSTVKKERVGYKARLKQFLLKEVKGYKKAKKGLNKLKKARS